MDAVSKITMAAHFPEEIYNESEMNILLPTKINNIIISAG